MRKITAKKLEAVVVLDVPLGRLPVLTPRTGAQFCQFTKNLGEVRWYIDADDGKCWLWQASKAIHSVVSRMLGYEYGGGCAGYAADVGGAIEISWYRQPDARDDYTFNRLMNSLTTPIQYHYPDPPLVSFDESETEQLNEQNVPART